MLVEVCANSLQSALNAEKAGADRIELCSELAVGGITPSYGLLKAVSNQISIPVRVLIRPRSGNFTYSDAEFDIMKSNIKLCADMGFEGVVVGMLHHNFSIDEKRMLALYEMNHGLKITFHRAFDWVTDPYGSLEYLQTIGIDTILTSGQQNSAQEGIDLLTDLNKIAANITIMPGSGINTNNAHQFKVKGFKAIHLSAVKMNKNVVVAPKVPMYSSKMLSDVAIPISNVETIQEVVKSVK